MFIFTFGQLEFFILTKTTNALHLILFILVLYSLILEYGRIKNSMAYIVLSVLVFLPLLFLSFNGHYLENISRWSWFLLLAMLPIHASFFPDKYLITVKYVVAFYAVLGLIIIADSSLYFLSGSTFLFEFEFYITPRFSGPFNDPNFLGIIYALVFIFSCGLGGSIFVRLIFLTIILLSGSISVIVFLAISMLMCKFNLVKRPILFFSFSVVVSFFIIPVLFYYSDDIFKIFSLIVNFLFEFYNYFRFFYFVESKFMFMLYDNLFLFTF